MGASLHLLVKGRPTTGRAGEGGGCYCGHMGLKSPSPQATFPRATGPARPPPAPLSGSSRHTRARKEVSGEAMGRRRHVCRAE